MIFISGFDVFINGILLIILVLFLQCKSSFATHSSAVKKVSNNIIITKIKSNFIDVQRVSEMVYFYGDVIVERQDISILADKMVVYYDSDSKDSSKDQPSKSPTEGSSLNSKAIKKIEAEDNVKIFSEEFVATGKHGIYDPKQNNFILKDNVILNKGSSVAKGQKFVYNLVTKKSYLIGKKDGNFNQNVDSRAVIIINDTTFKDSKSNKKSPHKK